ncbi:hypothetical protein BDR03DRAFT_28259 [Suillus americanus]|nr:hypothetical protein BDR03DRAFT_28259 [Suillus americanus]
MRALRPAFDSPSNACCDVYSFSYLSIDLDLCQVLHRLIWPTFFSASSSTFTPRCARYTHTSMHSLTPVLLFLPSDPLCHHKNSTAHTHLSSLAQALHTFLTPTQVKEAVQII